MNKELDTRSVLEQVLVDFSTNVFVMSRSLENCDNIIEKYVFDIHKVSSSSNLTIDDKIANLSKLNNIFTHLIQNDDLANKVGVLLDNPKYAGYSLTGLVEFCL